MNNVMTDNNTINAKLDLLLAMTSANAGSPEYTRGKETTLDELALIWFDLKKNSICESSYGSYRRLYKYIHDTFGSWKIADIKRNDVQSWINNIRNDMSKKTMELSFFIFKAIMELGVRDDYIAKNPCQYVELPKKETTRKPPATYEQYRELLRVAQHRSNSNWIVLPLLYYTGCRIGEVLALTWNDIDFDNKVIHINKQYTINNNTNKPIFKDHTKTKAGVRIVPLHKELLKVLRVHYNDHKDKSPYIAHQQRNGSMLPYNDMLHLFHTWLDIANISGITLHSFRHTYICTLVRAGVPINTISRIVGHSDIAMTLNVYAQKELSPEDVKEVLFYVERPISYNGKKTPTGE